MDITIKNPCAFPVEFYSLDFDRQYLEEEEILRQKPISDGYDQFKNLLLPPRCPGDTLPEELLPKKPETPNDENNNEQITQNRTNSIINTDDQKDVEGIKFETHRLLIGRFNPYRQILVIEIFFEISVFWVVTQISGKLIQSTILEFWNTSWKTHQVTYQKWMSFPEIGLSHRPNIWMSFPGFANR